jgi:hypothetical protein
MSVPDGGLFFETTALVKNIVSGPETKGGILDSAMRFDVLATSKFARCEFEHVMMACYNTVIGSLRKYVRQNQPIPFNDLFGDALDFLPAPRVAGGESLLAMLTVNLKDRFGNDLVTARRVILELEGELNNVLACFLVVGSREVRDDFDLDAASCCAWPAGFPGRARCEHHPGENCRLKLSVIDKREGFFDCVRALRDSSLDEARGLKKIYQELQAAAGLKLLQMIGTYPGDFGDVIIFWEVPAGWAVLTRDRSFKLMSKYRSDVAVYRIRARRHQLSEPVEIHFSVNRRKGTLRNYSMSGALIHLPGPPLQLKSYVELRSATLGVRRARVIRRGEERGTYGLYFPGKIK